MKPFGIILIVVGFICLVLQFFPFMNREEAPEVKRGSLVMEKRESLPISSLLGVTAMATGGAVLAAAALTKRS
jgi:hypothetical protein